VYVGNNSENNNMDQEKDNLRTKQKQSC